MRVTYLNDREIQFHKRNPGRLFDSLKAARAEARKYCGYEAVRAEQIYTRKFVGYLVVYAAGCYLEEKRW